MLYEKSRELERLSMERWLSDEVFSFGWFLMLGILIVFYAVWLKLLDKRRITELLLIGSLTAVVKSLNSMFLGQLLGLAEYTIRLVPAQSNIFITSLTISPIIVMLAEQYSSTWGGYIIRTGIGFALLCFGIFSLYVLVGALKFYNWNVFYHILVLFALAMVVRCAFLWITGIQARHGEKTAGNVE